MTAETELVRLRRERNRFGTCAVLLVAVSLSIALPRKVAQYRQLKRLNEEIVSLQGAIGAANRELGETQREIGVVQQEISRRMHP